MAPLIRPASAGLASAAHLQPYSQGRLDGMCGIYAIINAARLAAPLHRQLDAPACERLFRNLIGMIEPPYRLRTVAIWGLTRRRWQALIDCVSQRPLSRGMQLRTAPLAPIRAVTRSTLLAALEQAILNQRPVLLLLRGAYDHFTVVSGYTPTRLILFDSWGYRWVERRSCGVGRSTPCRHRIAVKSVQTLEVL